MTSDDKLALKFKAGRVFTPSAPIDKKSLFAGRTGQITRLLNAVSQRGQHAVLFGERGVGKTSLANVLREFVEVQNANFLTVSTNCEANTTFKSLWKNVLSEIQIGTMKATVGFNPDVNIHRGTMAQELSSNPTPEEIRMRIQEAGPTIVIIDEIDRIKDTDATTRLADTIKTLSDHSVDCTLILVGVADSVDKLIAQHLSIERALVQIPMPRMSTKELIEIVQRGLTELNMQISDSAATRISALSHGLPHYTHALSLYAAQAAIDRDAMKIEDQDVNMAIDAAIASAQQSIIGGYTEATNSPRDNLYAEVLLACALAGTDQLGYFRAADVREPMSMIMGKRYEIPAFSQHLNDFCKTSRGAVLQKTGYSRRFKFRFVNPLMEPFVVMKGISSGKIKPESLDAELKAIRPPSNERSLPLE